MKYRILLVLLLSFTSINAQIDHPRVSPQTTIEQNIGLATVKVVYSRPAVRGRKIMGELVPYGRIWRVGANESTKFSTDKPITINGNILEPGTYALYAFPSAESWEFAFHANTSHWGDGRTDYDPAEDIFRIKLIPEKMGELRENFLISFDHINHNGMEMILEWEYTRLRIPIDIDTDAQMQLEIEKQIQGNPTAQTYYEAARYLQEQQIELDRALKYVNTAIEIGGDTYYYHRIKSLLEASLGNYPQAVEAALKSLELARSEGKDEFVRMNQRNIDKWNKLLLTKE